MVSERNLSGWRRWRHDHAVGLFTSAIVLLLVVVGVIALLFLFRFWDDAVEAGSEVEVVKICLQVLGVVVVGAFITLGGAALESARAQRAEKERQGRTDAAEAAEQLRRDLEIRSELLDRASRCAQDMFIHCKHVKRRMSDAAKLSDGAREKARRDALGLLDAAYLKFATESRALTNLIEARYYCAKNEPLLNPDGWPRPECRIPIADDQAGWRWHQVEDLLTVAYFGLHENWRNRILEANSLGYEGKYHSGYDLKKIWDSSAAPHDGDRYKRVCSVVQQEYVRALPEFVEALLTTRSRPEPTPSHDGSAGQMGRT